MNHYVDQATGELYAYDDEQAAQGLVKEGLTPCPTRPSNDHVWNGGWILLPPPAPTSTTPLEYIERFTEAEQNAVATAALSNPGLYLWFNKLMAAQEVVFSDPRLSAGLDALVAAGLITVERKAELLTP